MKKLNRDELNKKLKKKITANQNLKVKRKLISDAYNYNFYNNKIRSDIRCFIESLISKESERVTDEIERNAKAIDCLAERIQC